MGKSIQRAEDLAVEFIWTPHALLAIGGVVLFVIYFSLYSAATNSDDLSALENLRNGFKAAAFVLFVFGCLYFPDGPFTRPHPIVWRAAFSIGMIYELGLIVLVFQTKQTAREYLKVLDPNLGVHPSSSLMENYAEDCSLTMSNIRSKLDVFVLAHFGGYVAKALVFHDWHLLMFCSFSWELLEIMLVHMLPNFAECWWDQWILDFLLCNFLGSVVGVKLCEYLEIHRCHWVTNEPQYPANCTSLRKFLIQFTPIYWAQVRWLPLEKASHFWASVVVSAFILTGELNSFFLKHLLWIPTDHAFNAIRLVIICLFLAPSGLRQFYFYICEPNDVSSKKAGSFIFLGCLTYATETCLVVKLSKGEFLNPMSDGARRLLQVYVTFLLLSAIYVLSRIYRFQAPPNPGEQSEPVEQSRAIKQVQASETETIGQLDSEGPARNDSFHMSLRQRQVSR